MKLGKFTDSDYIIEFKEEAKPFPTPRIHELSHKKEVDELIKIGIIKRINNSKWAAPIFILSKRNGTIIGKSFPIPNTQSKHYV